MSSLLHKLRVVEEHVHNSTCRFVKTTSPNGYNRSIFNFRRIFETKTIYRIVDWSSVLCGCLGFYSYSDMKITVDGMNMLERQGIGTEKARKKIRDAAYVAYYRDTGLYLENDRPPTGVNLAWLKDEVAKQQASRLA